MNFRGKLYSGVGYIGEGPYKTIEDGVPTQHRQAWKQMLRRCYGETTHKWYEGCTVDSRWHDFQVFSAWYCSQPGISQHRAALDKDLLVKGNKVYSSETCCILPFEINNTLIRRKEARGSLPIGVWWNERAKKFLSSTSVRGKHIKLGLFTTHTDAFYAYKKFKEDHVKYLADKYRGVLSDEAYSALHRFTVDIDD